MSQWTHMVGTIQCSWSKEQAEEYLGKPVLWEDWSGIEFDTPEWKDYYENVWSAAFDKFENGEGIPMGSEGSVDWYFSETNDDPSCLGMGGIIAIQGDLRDFGGEPDIKKAIDWFVRAAKWARFATLTIKDEWSTKYIHVIVDWGHIIIAEIKEDEYENN